MRCATHTITPDSIKDDSARAQQQIEETILAAERLKSDIDQTTRLSEKKCRRCYYLRKVRIGGAAITERDCGSCGVTMTFGSTATDVICKNCATKLELCMQCGSRLDV